MASSLLLACQPQTTAHQAELFVFGTLVEVEIGGLPETQANALIREIEQDFQQLHRDWHAWEPGQLEALNEAIARGDALQVNPDLAELLATAQVLEQRSLGTFNPAIGNLIRLWGFHTSDYPVTGPLPTNPAIKQWVAREPSLTELSFDDQTISSGNRWVRIDLGGIAKGAAVDRAIAIARNSGASSALLNAGGDLRAFGRSTDGPWRIAIRDPAQVDQEAAGAVLAGIEIHGDEAIFTSGNYGRFGMDPAQPDGQRYAHIIDPRNGQPVDHIASATVIADNGTLADAAATALVVAGPNQWRQVAISMGIDSALLVDHRGCLLMTETMRTRLDRTPESCR